MIITITKIFKYTLAALQTIWSVLFKQKTQVKEDGYTAMFGGERACNFA